MAPKTQLKGLPFIPGYGTMSHKALQEACEKLGINVVTGTYFDRYLTLRRVYEFAISKAVDEVEAMKASGKLAYLPPHLRHQWFGEAKSRINIGIEDYKKVSGYLTAEIVKHRDTIDDEFKKKNDAIVNDLDKGFDYTSKNANHGRSNKAENYYEPLQTKVRGITKNDKMEPRDNPPYNDSKVPSSRTYAHLRKSSED